MGYYQERWHRKVETWAKAYGRKENLENEIKNIKDPKKLRKLERKLRKAVKKEQKLWWLSLKAEVDYNNTSEWPGHSTRGPFPAKCPEIDRIFDRMRKEVREKKKGE